MAAEPLTLLLVEDCADDAALLLREIRQGGYEVVCQRVETAPAMRSALALRDWDVVVADYSLPEFSGIEALALLRQHGQDIPFIIVSGVIGEETAVAAMKAGANDYVLKANLSRLVPALRRELAGAQERRQRARADRALEREQAYSRLLLESANELIIGLDRQGCVSVFNAAAERAIGRRRGDVLGKSWLELAVPERWLPEVSRLFDGFRRKDVFPLEVEYPVVSTAGDERMIAWRHALLTAETEPSGIIAFGIDVTERCRLEAQALQLANEQAARAEADAANRTKSELLAVLSHEIRTPQTALLGYVHLLRRSAIDAKTRTHALDVIERTIHVQTQIVSDALDVSRIAMGKLRLDVGPTDLAAIATAALDIVAPIAAAKGVAITTSLADAGPVTGDAVRLQQVVWNLLSNAVKFTPRGGRVDMTLYRNGSDVVLRVADTGEGIAPDFLPFVFDRFRQGDGDARRHAGGLGLGLTIVRTVVERHGGSVTAESDGAGKGAVFTVVLPG